MPKKPTRKENRDAPSSRPSDPIDLGRAGDPVTLRRLAALLRRWGGIHPRDCKDARDAAREALALAVDNLDPLDTCRKNYGCHRALTAQGNLFDWLEGAAASKSAGRDLGAYWCWWDGMTQPRLFGGTTSFPDELERWAEAVERDRRRQGGKGKPPAGGRPAGSGDTQPQGDRKTARAWVRWRDAEWGRGKGNHTASYARYAAEKGLDVKAVEAAVDRDRKRQTAPKAKRTPK